MRLVTSKSRINPPFCFDPSSLYAPHQHSTNDKAPHKILVALQQSFGVVLHPLAHRLWKSNRHYVLGGKIPAYVTDPFGKPLQVGTIRSIESPRPAMLHAGFE